MPIERFTTLQGPGPMELGGYGTIALSQILPETKAKSVAMRDPEIFRASYGPVASNSGAKEKSCLLVGHGTLLSRHVCKPRRVRHIEGASGLRCSAL